MAQKYLVQLVDDLTGETIEPEAGESLRFGLDGASYVIDLSSKNSEALRKALAPYVSAARKSEAATAKAKPAAKSDLGAMREWANSNGYKVSSRGRIPVSVQEAYAAR